MTEDPNTQHEEARLAALLHTMDANLPPPDAALIESLRQRTEEAFAASSPIAPATAKSQQSGRATKFWRGLAALAATVIAVIGWLSWSSSSQAVPFSQVLADLRTANTLQLRVSRAGLGTDVWVRLPGNVRLDESPGRYRIAAGSQLWKIDEAINTAAAGDAPWFSPEQKQIDLLQLLECGLSDSSALLTSQPTEKMAYAGRECFVYRANLPSRQGQLQVEAFADARTRRLAGIVVWPGGDALHKGPPLAELQLVAIDGPVDETKFVVAKSLTEDGRIGKVSDAQGIVLLRPALSQRWTPICRDLLLKPGDWLRTDLRGANAAKVRLSSDVELTLGPGTLVECITPVQARLHTGEVQVHIPKGDAGLLELFAPRQGSEKIAVAGKQLWRVDREEKLVPFKQPPLWLAGFEGTSSTESLGSLIVKLPDGRNEPLTVGYHKVSVEIRDQIARTTIEESFVNHTASRLEGVFHFPLPQDASISGFGMWIGSNLIEADIVEKQRAREIYETILRENRDPGLLEWAGGNLFKARVFPIEANSEKRVKIVYTQVLPLRGNSYRYSYGLRSELLRTKPLRELSLSVMVNSAAPLKSVTCPTHSARLQQTAHSAQVDFAAQQYTPDRDFEIACEVDGHGADVVVVPHRRGKDGYFLVQLMPPAAEGTWQREVVPDGKPLTLVLLCDTSGSMDSQQRKQQAEFVAAMLLSLGEKDRFLLAAADVDTVWAATEPLAPTAENIVQARAFLDGRWSLGWTDLRRAFAAVLKKAPPDAHVIYIGDGIVSTGETDPAAFVKQLGRLVADTKPDGKPSDGKRTLHAVGIGNTFESMVLQGIAAVGGGTVRNISGEQTPRAAALELLAEITRPGLRDLNVEFRGLKVAAVYPDRLPRLAAGTQQILVGRYLPTENPPAGENLPGEVIVTGRRGAETVRYAAKFNLKDAEQGNSFIPRLWARAHLDQLLKQGSSDAIRDQIIALSEEFHIITHYTSLLVLETDADRERFAVKRRYEMRDGEQFFAQGRNAANYDLQQQQIERAGDWRIGLRRQVLQGLAGMGRHSQQSAQSSSTGGYVTKTTGMTFPESVLQDVTLFNGRAPTALALLPYLYADNAKVPRWQSSRIDELERLSLGRNESTLTADAYSGPISGARLGEISRFDSYRHDESLQDEIDLPVAEPFPSNGPEELSGQPWPAKGQSTWNMDRIGDGAYGISTKPYTIANPVYETESNKGINYTIAKPTYRTREVPQRYNVEATLSGYDAVVDGSRLMLGTGVNSDAGLRGAALEEDFDVSDMRVFTARLEGNRPLVRRSRLDKNIAQGGEGQPDYLSGLGSLFPLLSAPPRNLVAQRAEKTWPADAIALSKSLLRTDSLHKLPGGIELRRTVDTLDPRWQRRSLRRGELNLYSPTAWLARPLDLDQQTIVNYCDEKERGAFSLAFLLGQARASTADDLRFIPFALDDYSVVPLHESYRALPVKIEPAGENRVALFVSHDNGGWEYRFTIDTARHVLLKQEWLLRRELTWTITYHDFIEVAGSWWARRIETTNSKGRKIGETTHEIKALQLPQYTARIKAELETKFKVQFLRHPLASLAKARQRVADGSADFGDRVRMIQFYAGLQQWDELLAQLDAAEKLSADKSGVRWLRTMILSAIRRNETCRERLLGEARQLAAKPQQDELFLADFLVSQAQGVASTAEHLEFVQLLKPVYDRQPAELSAKIRWQDLMADAYERLGRTAEALPLRQLIAEQLPWETYRQTRYAQQLQQIGQASAAYAWLQKQLDRPVERDAGDDLMLRSTYADLLRTEVRWEDLLKYTGQWIERNPDYDQAYSQHLSALVYNNKLAAANALAQEWLRAGRVPGKLTPPQRARLNAAMEFALGRGYSLSFNQMDERFNEPLAETARFFASRKDDIGIVRIIMRNAFTESAACDRLRGYFLEMLQADAATQAPEQLGPLVEWTLSGRIELAQPVAGRKQMLASDIPSEVWRKIAAALRERWTKTTDPRQRHALGETVSAIYANRFAENELLPFLRDRVATARPEYRPAYAAELFERLLSQPWTDEIEQEAFDRLRELSDAHEAIDRLPTQYTVLPRLVDAMIAARLARAEQTLRDAGKLNELTRTELLKKREEFLKVARIGLATRLAAEAQKERGPLRPWLWMEQAHLDVHLEQRLPQIEAECWQILGEAPPKQNPEAEPAAEISMTDALKQLFDALLRQRAFAVVANLAARRDAKSAAGDRVLKYVDAGIAQGGVAAAGWRMTKFQLLVALDRPDDLERDLRAWTRNDESLSPWRKLLGLLVAERGRLPEAIRLFEAAEKDRLLSGADYQTLAGWYLALDRRDSFENATLEAMKQSPEGALYRHMSNLRYRWSRNDLPPPGELDDNSLLAIRALFEKAGQPENYLWELQNLYGACRDFRLLQVLPDAVVGRSPQQVYAFLKQLTPLLTEIRSEAPADQLLARIKNLRERKLSPTDLRALDMLEAMVERRSSEVLNQPGPHVEASLEALKRSFVRQWGDGEPLLMAEFLNSLGTLPHPSLIAEQLRQLRVLSEMPPAGSRDRLLIVNYLSSLMFYSYNQRDAAIETMQAEVARYQQAHQGRWPHEDNSILDSYVGMLEGVRRCAEAETVVQKFLDRPQHGEQRRWLRLRLMSLYNQALENDGAVSLGQGDALFQNLVADGVKKLDAATDENTRHSIVNRLSVTLNTGHRKQFKGAPDLVRKFAFETVPAVLARQSSMYRNTVAEPLYVVSQVLGPRVALTYLVERMEQYPDWLEVTWNNSFNALGGELAHRRHEAAEKKLDIRDIERRILKLVIDELKRGLRSGNPRSGEMYYVGNTTFWKEKTPDFARAASEVYAERKLSGRRVQAVAQYLWHGLNQRARAIEVLLAAHAQGLLDLSEQDTLIAFLHEEKRFAESIPLLEPRLTATPDVLNCRTLLMIAYARSQRQEQLLELLKQTDAHFHEHNRWQFNGAAELGKTCVACNLPRQAVGYLNEAIALFQKSYAGSPTHPGTLSGLYRHLAQAHSALGRTKDAVDAASAAIVAWGPQHHQRGEALATLTQVLEQAKDLPGYVRYLDEQATKTAQDSPILRKTIGQVFQLRNDHARAIVQLRLAVTLQPNDRETHQALIACLDATKDKPAAKQQLLRLIDEDRRNLALYQQLADRLSDNPAEAERAVTSIVEVAPQETENHTALAELRQKQGRWDDAISHWQRVATLRRLEPTGLLRLAEAQLHQKQWPAASKSLDTLQKTEWPTRFGDTDEQIRKLRERLPK